MAAHQNHLEAHSSLTESESLEVDSCFVIPQEYLCFLVIPQEILVISKV